MRIYTGAYRRGRSIELDVHLFHARFPLLCKRRARALKKRERREARLALAREAA